MYEYVFFSLFSNPWKNVNQLMRAYHYLHWGLR